LTDFSQTQNINKKT